MYILLYAFFFFKAQLSSQVKVMLKYQSDSDILVLVHLILWFYYKLIYLRAMDGVNFPN